MCKNHSSNGICVLFSSLLDLFVEDIVFNTKMKPNSSPNLLIGFSITFLAGKTYFHMETIYLRKKINDKNPTKFLSFFCNSATAYGASLNHNSPRHIHIKPFLNFHHHNLLHARNERSFWSNPVSGIISYGTKLHFDVNVTNLESDDFESTEFALNGLTWKVKFRKASGEDDNEVEDTLYGYLVRTTTEFEDIDWLCDAVAVFDLTVSNDNIVGKIVKKLKHDFNKDTPQHSIELIDWSALMANCVRDGKFSVDVEVFVGPKRNMAIDMTQVASDFRVMVEDVSEMGETISPNVHVQGVGWEVSVPLAIV